MNNVFNCVRIARKLGVMDRFTGLLKKFDVTGRIKFHSQRLEGNGYYLESCDADKADIVVAVPVAGKFFEFRGERQENYLGRDEVEEIFDIDLCDLEAYLKMNATYMLSCIAEADASAEKVLKDLHLLVPEVDPAQFDPKWVPAEQVLRYINNYTSPEETTQLEKFMNIALERTQYHAIRLARYDYSKGNSNAHREELLKVLRNYNDGVITLDRYPVSYLDLYLWLAGVAKPETVYEIRTRLDYMFTDVERNWFLRAVTKR